jgi:hypothetical protein
MSDKSYIAFLELNKEAANNAILGVYINLFDELNKVDISEADKIMDTIKMHHTNMKKINELFDDAIKNEQRKTIKANKEDTKVDTAKEDDENTFECEFCDATGVCKDFGGYFFCESCEVAGARFIIKSGFPF